MVDEVITKQELIDAQKDAQSLDDFINGGDEQIVVTRLLKEYPTLANAIRQIYEKGGKFYPTLAVANADIANIRTDVYVITGDNGAYYKATAGATALTKSPYDPIEQAKSDATTKANAAKSEAIATASSDATTKANTAETNAKSYTDQKTALKIDGVLGKNLFDKSKVIVGKGLNDTGSEIVAATRSISDFIPVLSSTAYSFTATTKVCFYDVNKSFVQVSFGALANVISAATAAFMRIDVVTASLDQVQAELGTVKTAYEPYTVVLSNNSVGESAIKNGAVSGDKLQPMTVQAKHLADAVFLNMHDPSKIRLGLSISTADGKTETINAAFDVTEYIPCQPSTQYSASAFTRVFYYDKDGDHISNTSTVTTFTTPPDCYQLRFQIASVVTFRFQLNIGSVLTSPQQPYKYRLPQLVVDAQTPDVPEKTKSELDAITARKYNLSDAWVAWRNGEKFPVCFLGDSTTNGNGTTGFTYRDVGASLGQDYIAPNSYPSVFQALIREITGNTVMRAYNAGFSGQRSTWALANIDDIMGSAYADAKMIGISHGINDRTVNPALYATNFYRDIEGLIKWALNKGIQPFLMTTQPVTIPQYTGSASGSDIEEVGNEIKRNLAAKYDLELVDVNKYGQQFMQYSTKPLLNDIMEANSNVIHFGNGGHKFTAELLFAHFCKRCIWTTDGERLDYSTQLMFSRIEHSEIKQIVPFKQEFKVELSTTQTTAENKLLQEFWVFNAGRKQLSLTAYYANAVTGQYVEVDGVQTTIASQGQALATLDLGLHKIKAYSGATTQLDWLGFKLI